MQLLVDRHAWILLEVWRRIECPLLTDLAVAWPTNSVTEAHRLLSDVQYLLREGLIEAFDEAERFRPLDPNSSSMAINRSLLDYVLRLEIPSPSLVVIILAPTERGEEAAETLYDAMQADGARTSHIAALASRSLNSGDSVLASETPPVALRLRQWQDLHRRVYSDPVWPPDLVTWFTSAVLLDAQGFAGRILEDIGDRLIADDLPALIAFADAARGGRWPEMLACNYWPKLQQGDGGR